MQGGQQFDWRSLGKADYSQAAALVASLPADVRSEIKGVSDEILRRLVHLMWYRAEHSGRGSAYAWPSLATLGAYCLRSVRTVQRHLESLVRTGLLQTKARYLATGVNTSNLYVPGPRLLASLFARRKRKSSMIPTTTKMSYNDLKREYKAGAPTETGSHAIAVETKHRTVADETPPSHKPYLPPGWMSHRVVTSLSLVASGRNDTAWDEEQTDPNAERKALLKQQAAALKARGL